MTTVTLWILLAVSSSSYNAGTTTVIAQFSSKEACDKTAANMPVGVLKSFCVEAKGALR